MSSTCIWNDIVVSEDEWEEKYLSGEKKHGLVVDKYGTHYWYEQGALHKENGPAIVEPDGTEYWFLRGVRQPSANSDEQIRIL